MNAGEEQDAWLLAGVLLGISTDVSGREGEGSAHVGLEGCYVFIHSFINTH